MINMSKTTVEVLKQELKKLGAKVTGNKAALEERLKTWREKDLHKTLFEVTLVPSIDSSQFPSALHQPLEKLSAEKLEWLSPSVISEYFSERMAGKGLDKGRKLFMCQFLKNLSFFECDSDIYFVCKCSAEMKKNIDYEVKLHINTRDRVIMKSQCQCPAGKGHGAACKHVSAVLFGIEFYAVTGKAKQNVSCTSMPQQWHKPSESGRGIRRTTVDEMLNITSLHIEPDIDCTNFICNAFSKGKLESALFTRRCNLRSYLNDHQYCKDSLETIMLNQINKVTPKAIKRIERRTRTDKMLWYSARKSRITASIAHNIIRTCRTKKYATSFLVNHILGIRFRVAAVQWGISNEECALKHYCRLLGHERSWFRKCGTLIDENIHFLSATPDAIDSSERVIVEIKCPYKMRFERPGAVEYLQSGKLKSSHSYYTQVQLQMHVTNVHLCDFVVWTTKGIYVELIKYDAVCVAKYLKAIEFYYQNVYSEFYFKIINEQ